MAEIQELITDLQIRDNLSLGLAKAKDNVGNFGDTVALQSLKANNALGNLGDNVRAKFSGIGEDIKRGIGLGLGIGTVQLIAGATNAIQGFFSEAVQGAIEEEAGLARLNQTLKANIAAWDGNTAAIEKAISARTNLGFTDDALRASFTTLVAATHDVQEALDIQNVAMDLARFRGISLQEASAALTTIEAGRARGLAQLGINVKDFATTTERLAAVEKVAGGQARTFAEQTAGSLEVVGAKIDQLKDRIGDGLIIPIKLVVAGAGQVADLFSGALSESLQSQGEQVAKQAGEFVKTATRAQIEAAREGVRQDLEQAESIFGPKGASPDIQAVLDILDVALAKTAEGFEETNRASLKYTATVEKGFTATHTSIGLTKEESDARLIDTSNINEQTAALYRLNVAKLTAAAPPPGGFATNVEERTADTSGDDARFFSAQQNIQFAIDQAKRADDIAAGRKRDRDERLAQAKADQEAFAQAQGEKVDAAFDKTKRTADTLFDALHNRHLQAINDAEKLAETQHTAATQAIDDALKARLAANAAPVTEAEKRQAQIELSRQRRDFGINLQTALAGGDPLAIRSAQEAIQSFNANQRIAGLRETQAKLDVAAQAEATAAHKVADDKLDAAKLEQARLLDIENKRAKKQQDDYDRRLEALKKRDATDPAKFAKDAAALDREFGITTDLRGFHHIGDVLATAIKNVTIPAPNVTLQTTIYSPPIYLNARLIAAAMASGQSATATPGVRTGTLTPKP